MMLNGARQCVFFMLCTSSAWSLAASDDNAVIQGAGPAIFISSDSEDFSTRRAAIQYMPRFRHGDALTGIRYTRHFFEQNDWSRRGHQISVLHRDVDTATATGWQMEAGVFQQRGHDLLTLDGAWRKMLGAKTGLELMVSRDWVETANALDRGIHFTFVGASLDQGIGEHVTVTGLVGRQDFSNNNNRNHGRIRVIVQPNLDLGLTIQARYRAFESTSDDVGGAYFNPDDYQEAMLALGWRHRIGKWTTNIVAGVGRQEVSDSPRMPTYLLEIGIQSPPVSDHSFRLRGGINRSSSFQGPDYRYRYLQAEWIIGF